MSQRSKAAEQSGLTRSFVGAVLILPRAGDVVEGSLSFGLSALRRVSIRPARNGLKPGGSPPLLSNAGVRDLSNTKGDPRGHVVGVDHHCVCGSHGGSQGQRISSRDRRRWPLEKLNRTVSSGQCQLGVFRVALRERGGGSGRGSKARLSWAIQVVGPLLAKDWQDTEEEKEGHRESAGHSSHLLAGVRSRLVLGGWG